MATRKDQFKARLLGGVIAMVVRCLGWTLRYRVEDPHGLFGADSHRDRALIWLVWHNRILSLPPARCRFIPHRQAVVLTSASGDGEILAEVCRRFRLGAVRGSSSRRGRAALLALHRHLAAATDVIITPDGPRGPRYRIAPGAIHLGARTGTPVVPVRIEYSRKIELKTWDRFQLPLPFSRVRIVVNQAVTIDPAVADDDTAFEGVRENLQYLMGGDGVGSQGTS